MEQTEATQTPAALAALLSVACCALVLAKRYAVKVSGDWLEQLCLYVLVAMKSGERRSAVFQAATLPLREWELREAARLAEAILERQSWRRILTSRVDGLERALAKENDAGEVLRLRGDLDTARRELGEKPEIVAPLLMSDYVTPERLVEVMAAHGERMAILSSEGELVGMMRGRYSDGRPNLDVYLRAYSGDQLRRDRVSGATTYLERPTLTIALAVQPVILEDLGRSASIRERGVQPRFLYGPRVSAMGHRELTPRPMSAKTTQAYAELFAWMLAVETNTRDGRAVPHLLTLSGEAASAFLAFRGRIERALRDDGQLGTVQDWGSKLPGATARIAGVLHAVTRYGDSCAPQSRTIAGETMAAAVRLAEVFLVPHALADFGVRGPDARTCLARRMLRWLSRHPETTTITRRQMQRELGITTAEELNAPLALLEEYGYLRQLEQRGNNGKPGRRPSAPYAVNPTWDRRGLQTLQTVDEFDTSEGEAGNPSNTSSDSEVSGDDREHAAAHTPVGRVHPFVRRAALGELEEVSIDESA